MMSVNDPMESSTAKQSERRTAAPREPSVQDEGRAPAWWIVQLQIEQPLVARRLIQGLHAFAG
jgi:hypothetical protein